MAKKKAKKKTAKKDKRKKIKKPIPVTALVPGENIEASAPSETNDAIERDNSVDGDENESNDNLPGAP